MKSKIHCAFHDPKNVLRKLRFAFLTKEKMSTSGDNHRYPAFVTNLKLSLLTQVMTGLLLFKPCLLLMCLCANKLHFNITSDAVQQVLKM